jgi:hypothetical protein
MAVLDFSFGYVNTPPFFSGTSSTPLVPSVFPVAIDGRPYMIDQKSGRFTRGYEPRVRDSQDISTAPGEAAINPGGLWRRGQDSWHLGAGQRYADAAQSIDYRFYRSKGVNPWSKGQLSLLNDTKIVFPSSATNLKVLEVGGYVYLADGQLLRYTETPFADATTAEISSVSGDGTVMTYTTTEDHGFSAGDLVTVTGVDPVGYNVTKAVIATVGPADDEFTVAGTESGAYVSGGSVTVWPWKTVTGSPAAAINDITTDGSQVYVSFLDEGILMTAVGGSSMANHYATSGGTYNYTTLGFAKGFVVGFHNDTTNSHIHVVPFAVSTSHGSATATIRDPNFICTGIAGGQNSIYVAGRGTDVGLVYRMGIKTDGTLDVAVVALELPVGEYPTSIYGYLGFVVVGTNKGVRVCSADQTGNLIAGSLIPTGSDVKGFTAEDRFVWFTWTNFDATSGLGRLDFSNFVAANTPAYATDLMLASSNASVLSVDTADSKRVFTVSGVGVVVEDADSLVDVGYVESGVYRWGIPDRKFVAKVDTRAEPLQGSITSYLSLDESPYTTVGTWSTTQTTENTLDGSSQKAIQAGFKFELRPSDQHDSPVMTRWMTRAYAAPFRSQVFSVPILLHRKIRVFNKDYYYDTAEERGLFDNLIALPRVITMQLGELVYTVIVEDVEEIPVDSSGNVWDFEGTLVVTMRSVEN